MSTTCEFTLAELMIVAASEAWRDNGELIASGLGVIPRLGASLAKLSHSPQLLMTDSEAYLVEEPIPLGPRGDHVPKYSGSLNFERGVRVRLGWPPSRHDRPDPDRPLGPEQPLLRGRLPQAQGCNARCARLARQQHQSHQLVLCTQP